MAVIESGAGVQDVSPHDSVSTRSFLKENRWAKPLCVNITGTRHQRSLPGASGIKCYVPEFPRIPGIAELAIKMIDQEENSLFYHWFLWVISILGSLGSWSPLGS